MRKFETLAWPRADQNFQQPTQDIMQQLINWSQGTQGSASGKLEHSEEGDTGRTAVKTAKNSCNQNVQSYLVEIGQNTTSET